MRRLRKSNAVRDVVSEVRIDPGKLVMPIFVDENLKEPKKIDNMPGIFRIPISELETYLGKLEDTGMKSVIIFGIPKVKDPLGSSAYDSSGIVQKALKLCDETSRLVSIADLCLCEYTDHGHCGLLDNGKVDNDATLDAYGKIAVSYAENGVDIIAPSGMMDGQVSAIRSALDSANHRETMIMGYSAKYASNLYGPFREAVESTPQSGDRKSYQLDYRSRRQALREVELDEMEGADIVMVKPSLLYLDIVREVRNHTKKPLATYGVSAEYTMIKTAIDMGLAKPDILDEYMTAQFRAGADMFITYFAESYLEEKGKIQVR